MYIMTLTSILRFSATAYQQFYQQHMSHHPCNIRPALQNLYALRQPDIYLQILASSIGTLASFLPYAGLYSGFIPINTKYIFHVPFHHVIFIGISVITHTFIYASVIILASVATWLMPWFLL